MKTCKVPPPPLDWWMFPDVATRVFKIFKLRQMFSYNLNDEHSCSIHHALFKSEVKNALKCYDCCVCVCGDKSFISNNNLVDVAANSCNVVPSDNAFDIPNVMDTLNEVESSIFNFYYTKINNVKVLFNKEDTHVYERSLQLLGLSLVQAGDRTSSCLELLALHKVWTEVCGICTSIPEIETGENNKNLLFIKNNLPFPLPPLHWWHIYVRRVRLVSLCDEFPSSPVHSDVMREITAHVTALARIASVGMLLKKSAQSGLSTRN
eukprot:GHVR01095656.1.p1 GENE.GHVR01095656.1~~GHVR01095656.1.p1  ORF type:complete len:264 (-),score=19.55 GHVR01095656.1:459-1250(-)